MLAESRPTLLLASHDSALLAAYEPVAAASGFDVKIALTGEAAHAALLTPRLPALALLDVDLHGVSLQQLIDTAHGADTLDRCPIVLLSDTPNETWAARVQDGILDDLIPRTPDNPHWRIRLQTVLRTCHRMRALERLQAESARNAQFDSLTHVFNRSALLSILFRETDRVQRMRTPLCLLLVDIDDFGHWNERLGTEACDALLCEVAERSQRLLRSYDVLGRAGKDEFLIILPGCVAADAVQLAERLRADVFAPPFHAAGEMIRLSACFGISTSEGRSPVVVLREAEMSLQHAKEAGPESIQCFPGCAQPASPVTLRSAISGDKLLAW
ncbi:MAG: GGDEF domain-containing protein [Terracidiphilus sp.]|nr:GGDEF domain-containing protein [Terracidiphilus sp.]